MSESVLLDAHRAAEILGVAPTQLRDWRYSGTGPAYIKLGHKTIRYRKADLERFVTTRVVKPSDGHRG